MEHKILRLNATASGGRIIIAFSYPPSAESYKEYLEKPENTYDDKHEWSVAVLEGKVSMTLPSDITFEFPSGSKDAVLAFQDEAKAIKWEEKMLIWERGTNHEGTRRSISRSLTVGRLNEKLGLPGHIPLLGLNSTLAVTSNYAAFSYDFDNLLAHFKGPQG
ncbi:uncharacterized protein N7482_005470 [Penicillium canariense]|uniref:Uncharacterized protein n=1 Tax=Penicillium canariense TaxID=189055 RepID=A0A9W9LMA3_9EURO|nr:uncharacterized protein N7482_005470 [Penicillium canariense]KAJ5166689.1 hypothetical protein N7482_005470 [Penicillium canariense]